MKIARPRSKRKKRKLATFGRNNRAELRISAVIRSSRAYLFVAWFVVCFQADRLSAKQAFHEVNSDSGLSELATVVSSAPHFCGHFSDKPAFSGASRLSEARKIRQKRAPSFNEQQNNEQTRVDGNRKRRAKANDFSTLELNRRRFRATLQTTTRSSDKLRGEQNGDSSSTSAKPTSNSNNNAKNWSCKCESDINNSNHNNNYASDDYDVNQSGDFRAAFPQLRVSVKCNGKTVCNTNDDQCKSEPVAGAAIAKHCNKETPTWQRQPDESAKKKPANETRDAGKKMEKTIELAVFIDPALDNKFAGLSGGNIELKKQVLTIMSQVRGC